MKMLLKNRLKNNYHWLILAFLSVCFFIGTSSFNYLTQKNGFIKWGSPDETANYTFAKLYAQTGELSFFEKFNLYCGEIMHPRSMRSDAGWLKPVSFLGIILVYGKIASLTTYKIIPYLTPLFAAIGIIYYYLLIKKIFGKNNAIISACLLASFPPYIYYSARSMFHNVLFVDLLIIGLYYLIANNSSGNKYLHAPAETAEGAAAAVLESSVFAFAQKIGGSKYLSWFCSALAGLFIGLAIIARTSELLWLAPMLFILWLFNIKKIGITKLIIFLSFLGLAVLPALYWNSILFGSPWQSGYPEMNKSLANIGTASSELVASFAQKSRFNEIWRTIKDSVFYFGIHPKYSLQMFDHYFVKMFYWIFWPAVVGFILYFLPLLKSLFLYIIKLLKKIIYFIFYPASAGLWFDKNNVASHEPANPAPQEVRDKAGLNLFIKKLKNIFYPASAGLDINNTDIAHQNSVDSAFRKEPSNTDLNLSGEQKKSALCPVLAGFWHEKNYSAYYQPADSVFREKQSKSELNLFINRKYWAYLAAYAVMAIILLLYYGSWEFHDNPDPNQYTIGNSYTRYWLPIYLGAIPFAALVVDRLGRVFGKLSFERGGFLPPKFFSWEIRKGIIEASVKAALVGAVFFISLPFVLFGSSEGLVFAVEKNKATRNEYEKVMALTENNSVIITKYHDKLFFPERKVIVGLFDDDNMIREYANLAKYIPVYYYNFTLRAQDVDYLNSRRLPAFGLKIKEIEEVNGDFSLYKLEN